MVDGGETSSRLPSAPAPLIPAHARVAGLFVLLTALGLGVISTQLLLSAVLDCIAALLILVPPIFLGYGIVSLLPPASIPARWRLPLAVGLGLGATSLLVLGLGLIGVLSRPVWLAILGLFLLFGVLSFRRASPDCDQASSSSFIAPRPRWVYAWLLFVPFLVIALRNASNAPGFIWAEEGYGYDVLEYHLQVPKEYVQQGQISYLPHNVYANFPSNVEMLYLLSMIVHGESSNLGTVANMIHLCLGVLFVLALWCIGREWSPGAGMAAAFVGGTVGWLPYLCGLAYVENGMLFFGALSLAALLRASLLSASMQDRRLWMVLSGVFAGFACGCKYPAVPLIAVPLLLAAMLIDFRPWTVRLRHGVAFGMGCLVAFAPWLVKNTVLTGNPVFPLANSIFRATPPGWGADEDQRWVHGHSPSQDERNFTARAQNIWARTLGDPLQRFGPAVFLIPLALCFRRNWGEDSLSLLVVFVAQLLVWAFATHLFARFAVPLVLPLSAMVALGFHRMSRSQERIGIVAAVVLGAAWNISFAARLSRTEALSAAPESLFSQGQATGFEYLGVINSELPKSAKLLLIGDAKAYYIEREADYCVVFNRNPFVEAIRAAKSPADIMQWLRARNYTHILVNWSEVARLRATYGFASEIAPTLFDQLQEYGLNPVRSFPHPTSGARYIDLWAMQPTAVSP